MTEGVIDLLSVRLKNFVLYKDETFDFTTPGHYFLYGKNLDVNGFKSNGTGKTLLFDAVTWCLYGKTIRGASHDEIIGGFAPHTSVRCEWSVGSRRLSVTRHRNSPKHGNQLVVRVEGSERTKHTTSDTQDVIDKIFGMSYTSFVNVALHDMTCKDRFTSTKDNNRKAIYLDIGGLDRIDDALKSVRADNRAVIEDIRNLESLLERNKVRLEEATSRLDEHTSNADKFEKDKLSYIEELKYEIKRLKKKLANLLAETPNDVVGSIKSIESKLNNIDLKFGKRTEKYEKKWNKVRKLLDGALQDAAVSSSDVARIEKSIGLVGSVDSVCPTCKQAVGKAHVKDCLSFERKRLKEATSRLEDSEHLCKKLKSMIHQVEATLLDIGKLHNNKTRSLQERLASFKESAAVAKQHTARVEDVEAQIDSKERRIESIIVELNPWNAKVKSDKTNIHEIDEDISRTESKLASLRKRASTLAFWIDGFGPSGLKHIAVKDMVVEHSHYANSIASQLTNGDSGIEIEYISKTKRGKEQERVDIQTRIKKSMKRYELRSAGERARFDVAIDLGLNRLVKNRLAVCFFDEFLRGLDSVGIRRVLDMLSKEHGISKVICVDHNPEVASFMDHTITVTRRDGKTSITSVNYGRG